MGVEKNGFTFKIYRFVGINENLMTDMKYCTVSHIHKLHIIGREVLIYAAH